MIRSFAAIAAFLLTATVAFSAPVQTKTLDVAMAPHAAHTVKAATVYRDNLIPHLDALTEALNGFSRTYLVGTPAAPGTGTGASAGTVTASVPYYATNGNDIIESNGSTVYLTAPLIATTGASPVSQIAATTGKQIIVVAIDLTSSISGSTVQFQDEAGTPNKLSGVYTFAVDGQLVLPFNPAGYIRTLTGAALDIATTGSSNVVGGTITYCLN